MNNNKMFQPEPIFLKEIYKDYLWGGKKLKTIYNKETNLNIIAESWEIAANKNGNNLILNGKYKDMSLGELFDDIELRELIFGNKCKNMERFPLMIKFIDALNDLSIQVHPNDNYALKNENSYGKNEAWYIIDCCNDSKIICGLKNSDEELEQIITSNDIEQYLNFVDIKKGDTIYIPAGLIHAIQKGTLICEIQQNSDVTYRIYDYNRKDKNGNKRELHLKQAIDVIDKNIKPMIISENNDNEQILINNEYFNIQKIIINGEYKDHSSKESFYAICVLEGEGTIKCESENYNIVQGNSFLVPSNLGKYSLEGKMKILRINI